MNDIYTKELKKALGAPASKSGLSREEIGTQIARISVALCGPMPDAERLNLVEARAALRRELAALTG